MNTKQAKQLSLPEIMSRLGYEPVKSVKNGRELWYNSPFRKEQEPSFHTSYLGGKWIWNDFGDTGGTVIDFVMRHENFSQVKDALTYLERMFQGHFFEKPVGRAGGFSTSGPALFSFQQQSGRAAASDFSEDDAPERQLEFIEAHPLKNPVIFTYLERERRIPRALARHYLAEVKYWNRSKPKSKHKPFFAFGMKNEAGGYEIRAASDAYSFKSALITRDITLIRGRGGEQAVNIFEGMTDFLSLLTLIGTRQLKGDAIVMHSLSSFGRTVEKIREEGYARINTFLDNNDPGRQHTERFKEAFPKLVTSWSARFAPHTDLNDALKAGAALSFAPDPEGPNP